MAGKETAMIELTDQQRREIRESGWPPEVKDPRTGETFVLIHKEMFERVRAMLEAEDEIADIEEMYPLAAGASPEDA
jgi:hypothetical protein